MTTIDGHSRAAVQIAPHKMEIRELPLPELPADAGLLRVLRAGICGADVPMYADSSKVPRILGHENVGIIEKLGELAAERWGVKEGDYVALEEYLPCGHCDFCRSGEYRACELTNHKGPTGLRYGSTKTTVWPGLWGGYSQFTYIHPRAVLHKVPEGVSPRLAAMALPLGNGFQWAYLDGQAGPGQTVVVQGPGQQGLACVVAAKAAGARTVICTGLARDGHRLEVAKKLGADHVIAVDQESMRERVREITDGYGADLVLDVSSGGATEVINGGLDILKGRNGKLLTAAFKRKAIDGFDLDMVITKAVELRGVRGHSFKSVEMALDLMKAGAVDLEAMSTHEFGLEGADEAVRLVAGEIRDKDGNGAIHVTINPWGN
ncbi:MAG TPA: alcohol dehydrogenase catalytic domain-containing protein [Candidatus Binatia bacterium]|nr:alcohol dehydrogenase catalytic domain-containing protein [Candidatus Binatia bacterium]